MRNFYSSIHSDSIIDVSCLGSAGYQIHKERDLGLFAERVAVMLETAFSPNLTLDISRKWLVDEVKGILLSVVAERNMGLSAQQCEEKTRELTRGHSPSEEAVIVALGNFTADLILSRGFGKQQCFSYFNLNEGFCVLVRNNL